MTSSNSRSVSLKMRNVATPSLAVCCRLTMTVPRLRPARERLAGAVAILSEFNPLKLGMFVREKSWMYSLW